MRTRWLVGGAAALLFSIGAGSAQAQPRTFNMNGTWYLNRGPLVDIPINGGPTPCVGGQAPGFRANPQTGCQAGLKPANGGVPAVGATVMATGASPATLRVPAGAFAQALPKQSAAVAFVPTVVQLATTFVLSGPDPSTVGAAGGSLLSNAFSRDPNQSMTRAAAAFSWCPLGVGPGCSAGITLVGTTIGGFPNPQCTGNRGPFKCVATVGQRTKPPSPAYHGGTYNGLIRYKPGVNAFGGTMGMLIGGSGVVSISGGPLGTTGGINLAQHQLVGGVGGGSQALGRGYSYVQLISFPSGNLFQGFTLNFPCTMPFPPAPAGCSMIVGTGPTVGSVGADSNLQIGMPWTTGTVYAFNTGTNQGAPQTSLLTAMGSHDTTGLGQGTITVVAGGTTHRVGPNADFGSLETITFRIGSPKTPSTSPAGLAAGAVLMLLAVGYAARRRF